jgi:hypothetical protein
MEFKDFLTGVLSETLNIDETGVASLFEEDGKLKSDAKQTILKWNADNLSTIKKGIVKESFDDGYKKATSEVMTKFESDLKTKTGFKSDKKGVELVLDYAGSLKPAGTEITDDVIKKHPLYLSLQEEKEAAITSVKTEGEKALNDFKSEISKKETFSKVSQKALELFHQEKPILSADPIKAKRQEELFLQQFKGYDYEMQGDRIVVTKDGKVVENAQGHAVKFESLVKETAGTYFEFHAASTKASPGNNNGNSNGNTGSFTFDAPKTQEEYVKMLSDPKLTLEQRNAVDKAWTESQTS